MVSTGSPISSSQHEPSSQEDWPAQMAESIERVVGSVRDKTTGPALTNYLPDSIFGEEHTWVVHLLLGLLFTSVGLLLWARRRPRSVEQTPQP
jgi:hypothetical protein